MGVVYKAEDIKLKRSVALKFLPPHTIASEVGKSRFIHEAQAAAALDHSNIGTIYEIDEVDGRPFIAMAYIEGQTLKKKIESGPIAIDEVLEIAVQVARGLQAAHEKGIVHRDIKSANIMITPAGQTKIMDFGLARLPGRTQVTKEGMTLGTVAYMSPEQALGEGVDHRSDIWSLGVVLYEMLAGELPFKSEYEQALVYLILNHNSNPISAIRKEVSPEVESIVNKCLEKEASKRYQDASELLVDLYWLKGGAPDIALRWMPTKKKIRPFLLPGAAVLGLILLLVGYFLVPFREPAEPPSNALAVMYFENLSDPDDKDRTGEMLTNLLITSLSQLKALEVRSRQRIQNILDELDHPGAKTLSPSLTAEVAQRAGVKVFVAGSILQTRPTLAVTMQLVDVERGTIIGSQRLTDFSPQEIYMLADTLAQLVMNELNVAPSLAGERRSVADITTDVPAAYRAFQDGLEYERKILFPRAASAFEQAVELDSTFTEAHLRLTDMRLLIGDVRWRLSLQKASQLSGSATEHLRLHIIARVDEHLENNPRRAAQNFEQLIALYPNDVEAYWRLAGTYSRHLLEQEKGVEILRRGRRIDPSHRLLLTVFSYLAAHLNYKQEALEVVNEYVRLYPREYNPYDTKGDVFHILGDYDSSRVWWEKAEVVLHGSARWKLVMDAMFREDYDTAMGYSKMVSPVFIELHQGRLKTRREKLSATFETAKSRGRGLDYLYRNLIHLAYEQRDYDRMLKLAIESNLGKDYRAWAFLKTGKAGQGRKLLEELKGEIDPNRPSTAVEYDHEIGLLNFEEGNYGGAVNHFRRAFRRLPPNRDPNLFFAISLSKGGEVEEAVGELSRLTRWILFPYDKFAPLLEAPASRDYWPISQVKAWYWLGVVYEQRGEKEKAAESYRRFLDIWKDADFDPPELKDAKARLAALKEEHGT